MRVRLAVRHRQPGDLPEFPGETLRVGDRCNVRYLGRWCVGHVTILTEFHVYVKRCGHEMDPEIELLKRSMDLAAWDTESLAQVRGTGGRRGASIGVAASQGEAIEIDAETL